MVYSVQDREIVRDLARRVIECAHEPKMAPIVKRWADVNALRKPDRAPVYCRPVGCWSEILPAEAIQCEDPWLRGFEYRFRQILHKRDIGDDTPIDGYFSASAAFDVTPPNVWGVEIRRVPTDVKGGAWAYDASLRTEKDFDALQLPQYVYNDAKTKANIEELSELLGDIAPVKLGVGAPLSATLGNMASDLFGLEQMMLDMVDRPKLVHRLMKYMSDAVLGGVKQIEEMNMVTPNNVGAMTASDPIGDVSDGSGGSFKNCWCMANSQEFDQVSPQMWDEFCLQYQKPIFERYGLVGYGCCENLTHKIDGVLTIPNLRIFVSSAWTDLGTVLSKIGTDYCIMWRQKASDVVYSEESRVRDDLLKGAENLKGHYYQIVLRELQTLAGNLDRLHVWTRHAIEAAERFS